MKGIRLSHEFLKRRINNNFGRAQYFLAFAQYYPYGPNYFIFGGLYKIEKTTPKVWGTVGLN